MSARRTRELLLFFACAYSFSWLLWLPLVLGRKGLSVLSVDLPLVYVSVGTFGPGIAALLTQKIFEGNWRAFQIRAPLRPFVAGILVGSAGMLGASFLAAAWTTRSGYSLWNWSALPQIATLFLPNLLGGPLGEEPGWRGFALPRLQSLLHPLLATVLLGFLWATWHLPLFIVHFTSLPYWQYAPFMIAVSVIITFALNISGGSTILAIYLHGLLNVGIGIILNDFVGKAEIRKLPGQGAVLVMSFIAVACFIAIATRGRLGYRDETAQRLAATSPIMNASGSLCCIAAAHPKPPPLSAMRTHAVCATASAQ